MVMQKYCMTVLSFLQIDAEFARLQSGYAQILSCE